MEGRRCGGVVVSVSPGEAFYVVQYFSSTTLEIETFSLSLFDLLLWAIFCLPFLALFFLSCTVVSETTNYSVQAHPSNITLQFATHPRLFSSRIFRYLQLFSFSFLIDPIRFLVGSLGVCFAVCIIDDCCALQPASAYFQLYSSTRHPAATKPLLLPLRLVLLPTLVDRPDTIIRSLLYPRTSSSHAGAVSTSAPCVLI